ncbi:MAG: hypothetical protein U5L01_06145 [Rheinheimera sp.]|nr:hypothetical protein [Rheinheimera sp.]
MAAEWQNLQLQLVGSSMSWQFSGIFAVASGTLSRLADYLQHAEVLPKEVPGIAFIR